MDPFRSSCYCEYGRNDDVSVASSEKKSTTEACKSHKEAERRRRQRINAHLSTLRSLLPDTTKTDKATLLAEVVHHVRELKRKAADVARRNLDGNGLEPDPSTWPFPGELDEATLSNCDGGATGLVKATLCCEDRPGLNRDLGRAFRSCRAKPVRADMMTVGGRIKSVVVTQWAGNGEKEIEALKRALREVVENRVPGSGMPRYDKRARICGSFGNRG